MWSLLLRQVSFFVISSTALVLFAVSYDFFLFNARLAQIFFFCLQGVGTPRFHRHLPIALSVGFFASLFFFFFLSLQILLRQSFFAAAQEQAGFCTSPEGDVLISFSGHSAHRFDFSPCFGDG